MSSSSVSRLEYDSIGDTLVIEDPIHFVTIIAIYADNFVSTLSLSIMWEERRGESSALTRKGPTNASPQRRASEPLAHPCMQFAA